MFWVVVAVLLVRWIMWFAALVNWIVVWRRGYSILRAYCFSFYGSELRDLTNLNARAWRQALRCIWKLPYNCHAAILERLSRTVSLFDSLREKLFKLCTEMLKLWRYFSELHVMSCSIYSQMCSVMGRNVQYYCERFGVCCLYIINSFTQLATLFCNVFKNILLCQK